MFGSSSLVAIGVVVEDGTIFTPERIQKIREITRRLDGVGFDSQTEARDALRDELEQKERRARRRSARELDRKFPPYPVNHNQVHSLTHGSTRVIQIEADGSLTQEVLMKKPPKTAGGRGRAARAGAPEPSRSSSAAWSRATSRAR